MSARIRTAFERMAADMRRVFGDRFVGLVASGTHTAVAFATNVTAEDLEAFGPLVDSWQRDDLDTPLLLTPDEFRRSLDAFPVEYQALMDRHEVIAGHAPFDGVMVDGESLRRACEVQAKSHLIHLRQGWVDGAGQDNRLAAMLMRSAPALRALLADVARLTTPAADSDAMAGAAAAGLDLDLVRNILALETDPAHAPQLVRRLPDYLSLAQQLWRHVDTWRS